MKNRITPHTINDGVFENYHLAISRAQYKAGVTKGLYEGLSLKSQDLSIRTIHNPSYSLFSEMIQRVGNPWGWTRRPRYNHTNVVELSQILDHPETTLYLLQRHKETIGYCLTTSGKIPLSQALPGGTILKTSVKNIIEIENFGLFPEHTGQSYGRHFLNALFETLLDKYDAVYLSSRSTNHDRVISFYTRMGMTVLYSETKNNDLLPESGDLQDNQKSDFTLRSGTDNSKT